MMKSRELFGYKVNENGTILKLNGEPMKENKMIKVVWEDKSVREIPYAKFVYYAFHRDLDLNDTHLIIKHKDNNRSNFNLSNLEIVSKKDYYRENSTKSKLTQEQIEEIIDIYGNKEKQIEKNDPLSRVSYRKLAEKYGVSHTLIRAIITGNE